MYKNTKEPVCIKCKGQGIIEVFQSELGFETLVSCPECDREEQETSIFGGGIKSPE